MLRSINFDIAVWNKQPAFIKKLGKESNLYRLFGSIFNLLQESTDLPDDKGDSFEFLCRQLFLRMAEGKYLDEHGRRYDLLRKGGETDDEFRLRILNKLFFLSNLPSAGLIEDYVLKQTGFVVDITDSGRIGCINPDDAISPEQAIVSNNGDIAKVKHIYYEENPDLNIRELISVLGDTISPFVKYYLLTKKE